MEPTQHPIAMSLFFILLWIVLIVVVARYGRKRSLGMGWTLVISLFLSPVLAFIIALASGKKKSKDTIVV